MLNMKKKATTIYNNNIRMERGIAERIRAFARQERRYIGSVWEEAAREFLERREKQEATR